MFGVIFHRFADLTSHVAQIMRRLRRVCAAVGSMALSFTTQHGLHWPLPPDRHVRYVSCSATISSPLDHMGRVFGLASTEIEAITNDGAPAGSKEFLLWNPSLIDSKVPSLGRHGALSDATSLMRFLMKRGVRVILFCKVRSIALLVTRNAWANYYVRQRSGKSVNSSVFCV